MNFVHVMLRQVGRNLLHTGRNRP